MYCMKNFIVHMKYFIHWRTPLPGMRELWGVRKGTTWGRESMCWWRQWGTYWPTSDRSTHLWRTREGRMKRRGRRGSGTDITGSRVGKWGQGIRDWHYWVRESGSRVSLWRNTDNVIYGKVMKCIYWIGIGYLYLSKRWLFHCIMLTAYCWFLSVVHNYNTQICI